MNNQKIASEMMLTIAGGTDTQSSSDSWNDKHDQPEPPPC